MEPLGRIGPASRDSEMHSQAHDETEIIRLGFDPARTDLGVRDAIPDRGNIKREPFVEIN